MSTYTTHIETEPSSDDIKTLVQGLNAHASHYTQAPGFRPIAIFMRNEQDQLVAGIWGYINWNWLFIGLFWVSEPLRGQGHGTNLINQIEAIAKERGCKYAHLDTFSYQARPFYERLGYELFATLDDYLPGHQRFFLKKVL
jgi:GNAT superfamily N-acetyltransferase